MIFIVGNDKFEEQNSEIIRISEIIELSLNCYLIEGQGNSNSEMIEKTALA